jgi:hypothetical protein
VLLLAQLSASSASWQHLKVSLDIQQRGGRVGGDTEFFGSNAVLAAGVAKQAVASTSWRLCCTWLPFNKHTYAYRREQRGVMSQHKSSRVCNERYGRCFNDTISGCVALQSGHMPPS